MSFSNSSSVALAGINNNIYKELLNSSIQLYGSSNLPFNQIQNIFEIIENITNCPLNTIEKNLESTHKMQPNDLKVINSVKSTFQIINNNLKRFGTEHQRLKAIEESNNYIAPIEFIVGERPCRIKRRSNGMVKPNSRDATAFLFPLRTIFKKIFEMPGVYDTVFTYKNTLDNENTIISNFIQSNVWKNKIKNFKSTQVLPLFLFSDDYETGNGLGSHAGINKLAGTYVTIPCFPPHYQSSLNSIYQALLYFSNDREEFGNFAVFRTLINELKYLEIEGVELDLPQGKIKIYFKLGLILGDNLGLHSLLGIVENFNANFACRFCKMDKVQRSLATEEDKTLLRNKKSYEMDLKLLNPCSTGIKQNCIFHSLPGFHVIDNWSVDMMHDLLEGVLHLDMIHLINYYISKPKYFSHTELTNRIKAHDYGMIESRNTPPEILPKHLKTDKLKMSAGEMLTFVRHFGLIIGDFIPENDISWRVYLNIRQILDIISSTCIQKECSELLKTLITEHNLLAKTVLKRKLKFKDHILIHYGTVMRMSGPIINTWCMRFEAKHKESKHIVCISHSKKNICETIAVRHQLKLTYLIHSNSLFPMSFTVGQSYKNIISNLSLKFDHSLKANNLSYDSVVDTCNWVEKNGSTYKLSMLLCIGENDNSPRFGIIKYILIRDDRIFFVCQKIVYIFNNHFYAFQIINVLDENCIVNYDDLCNSYPIAIIMRGFNWFFMPRSSF